MSDPLASTSARYPKEMNYKPMVEEWLKTSKKKPSEDSWKKFKLADDGVLKITTRGKEISYDLKLTDGRRVVLEKTETTMSLLVTDKDDKPIKTLGCEL